MSFKLFICSIFVSVILFDCLKDTCAQETNTDDQQDPLTAAKCSEGFSQKKLGKDQECCIKFINQPKQLSDAQAYCQDSSQLKVENGTLIRINSEEDWNQILEIVKAEDIQFYSTIWLGYKPKGDAGPNSVLYFWPQGDNSDQSVEVKVNESFWKDNHLKCNETTGESVDPSAPSEDRVKDHALALHIDISETEDNKHELHEMHWFRQDVVRPSPFFCMVHVLSTKTETEPENNTNIIPTISTTAASKIVTAAPKDALSSISNEISSVATSSATPTGSTSAPLDANAQSEEAKKRRYKKHGSGGTVAVVFLFLLMAILGGAGFVLYRKRLWPFGPRRGHSSFGSHSYSTDQL